MANTSWFRGMDLEIITSWQQWEQWTSQGWTMLPFIIKSNPGNSGLPSTWKKAWEMASPYSVVLESGKGGRFTYLGVSPVSILEGKDQAATVLEPIGNLKGQAKEVSQLKGQPLEVLQKWMAPFTAPLIHDAGLPPFTGGCIGFLGYDVVRSIERLPVLAEDNPGFPDYLFMRMEEVWVYDHTDDIVYCAQYIPVPLSQTEDLEKLYETSLVRSKEMLEHWSLLTEVSPETQQTMEKISEQFADASGEWPGMSSAFSREQFEQAVLDVQEYIRQGDVFQVNLSLRQEAPLRSTPEAVYEWLRRLNPSPYMGLLRSPGFTLSSASPELLVKRHGDQVSARPIAGTRRRGLTPAEDAAMEAELRGSDKEIAEHIMLVDLERNDIGRVAAYGSVRVPELMTVERYSHVMHLVSQVEGTLAENKDTFDVIGALFPGGTITGAPKVRTMEII